MLPRRCLGNVGQGMSPCRVLGGGGGGTGSQDFANLLLFTGISIFLLL